MDENFINIDFFESNNLTTIISCWNYFLKWKSSKSLAFASSWLQENFCNQLPVMMNRFWCLHEITSSITWWKDFPKFKKLLLCKKCRTRMLLDFEPNWEWYCTMEMDCTLRSQNRYQAKPNTEAIDSPNITEDHKNDYPAINPFWIKPYGVICVFYFWINKKIN